MADNKNNFASTIMNTVSGSIGGAVNEVVGMGLNWIDEAMFGKKRRDQQIEQQKKLNDLQIAGQKELGEFNQGLQKDMFNYTSPKNMVKRYEDAGMNPALMYGTSGAGGSTTGSASAGSVTGGQASDEMSRKQAQLAQQGMALQMEKLASEIKVNESVANVNNTNADVRGGVEKDKIKEEIKLIQENTEIAKENKYIQAVNADFAYQLNNANYEEIVSRKLVNLSNEEYIKKSTILAGETIKKVTQEIENLEEANKLTKEQVKAVTQGIAESIAKIALINEQEKLTEGQTLEQDLKNSLRQTLLKSGLSPETAGNQFAPIFTVASSLIDFISGKAEELWKKKLK